MSQPWIHRCPEGHCSWRTRADGYWCERCEETFQQLVDAREMEATA